MCFCCGFTQFHFYYGHFPGRIWNPPLRSANPVTFCPPLTSAGWGHPALHPTEKGERRAASPLAAVPVCAALHHPGSRTTFPGHAAGHRPAGKKPPLSKGGGRRRRTEGFRRAMPCALSHPQTGRNPSASQARHLPLTREAFLRPTLNFTSNFTLAKYGKVCYNLIAYRFSGKYSRNPKAIPHNSRLTA